MENFWNSDEFDRAGQEYCENGDYDRAIKTFKEGLRLFPNTVELYSGLGNSYFLLNEYAGAIQWFKKGIEICPFDPDMNRGMGMSLLRLNRTKEAIKFLDRALPGLVEDPYLLGEVAGELFQAGEYSEAVRFCDLTVKINPDILDPLIYKGMSLHSLDRQPEEKYRCFEKALKKSASRPDLLDFYGNVLYDDGRWRKALEIFSLIEIDDISNPATLEKIIDLFKRFKVSRRKRIACKKRLQKVQLRNSLDGLIEDFRNEWERNDLD